MPDAAGLWQLVGSGRPQTSDEVAAVEEVRDNLVEVGIGLLLLETAVWLRAASKMWHGETMLPVERCGNEVLAGAGMSP